MSKEKITPKNPEEIAKAAQEAAIKAAMEQAQAMFGGLAGFQMPDMSSLQEQINAQMKAAVPNLEEIQAQQTAMGTLGGIDPETVNQAAQQNMAYASRTMEAMLNGDFEEDLTGDGNGAEDMAALFNNLGDFMDTEWEIHRKSDGMLSEEQNKLLAFGAPLLVYNSEDVDSIESKIDADSFREQLKSWWNITDKDSTFNIVNWLLHEGHHDDADNALAKLHEKGLENISDQDEENTKMEDVCLIVGHMLEEGYCTPENVPSTAIAWDLVRLVNLARWAYICGYVNQKEMWEIMQIAVNTAQDTFKSWEEYGLSLVLGRGVWHGDTDDCDTAQEIITTLLNKDESPWKQIKW